MSFRIFPGASAALLVTAALTQATPASAQVFCSEPVTPYCLEDSSRSRDTLSVTRCKQDVEDFATKVSEYLACLDENAADLKARVAEMRQQVERLEKQAEEDAALPPEE